MSAKARGEGPPARVLVSLMRQDPGLRGEPEQASFPASTTLRIEGEGPFLDGPVTPRVAVLDIDARTGNLRPGAKFRTRARGSAAGYAISKNPKPDYAGQPDPDIESDSFLQVSSFATVVETLQWFERPEVLGRQVRWAFGAPQLLVIPRAGEMANALYDRDSHSLQFFSVPSADRSGRMIHTALSRDIVVHETTHAILDGVAPDLLGAITPQARALHEAVADLAALFASLRDETQVYIELTHWGRNLTDASPFSRLAEQLGRAIARGTGAEALRDANNQFNLDPTDRSTDDKGHPNYIADVTDVYALSSVLTGSMFRVLLEFTEDLLARASREKYEGDLRASDFDEIERRVMTGAEYIARMAFRGLNYLPPGELSFADFGRAILAVDQAFCPDARRERDWLVKELSRRKVVDDPSQLEVPTNVDAREVKRVSFRALEQDDAFARSFVAAHRALFGIPPRARFTVQPRVRLRHRPRGGRRRRVRAPDDLVLKVSWRVVEPNDLGARYPRKRIVTMGATLVLDTANRRIRALLRGENGDPSRLSQERQTFLRRLVDEGLLRPPGSALGPDGVRLRAPMVAHSVRGVMVPVGGARMLHAGGRPGCLT